MSNKKMTKRDYFQILRSSYPTSAANYDEVINFIDHELELLTRKNSSEKKPTATQQANEVLKTAILDSMEDGKQYTISDMIKEFEPCAGLSTSKVSAIVRQMKDDGLVIRTEEKRKAYFSKVEG
jgi:predicted transcriptional regulator